MRRFRDDPNVICLVGLDPGTTNYGVGLIEVRVPQWEICHVAGFTIVAKPAFLDRTLIESHGERYARLTYIGEMLYYVFCGVGPYAIANERGFYNPKSPGAFGPLTEAVYQTRQSIRRYNPHLSLTTYSPMEIKAAIHHGHSGKEAVAVALEKSLGQFSDTPITTWLDHSSDGLGAAKCLFEDLRT